MRRWVRSRRVGWYGASGWGAWGMESMMALVVAERGGRYVARRRLNGFDEGAVRASTLTQPASPF